MEKAVPLKNLSEKQLRSLKRMIISLQDQYESAGFNSRVAYVMACNNFGYKELCQEEFEEELQANQMLEDEVKELQDKLKRDTLESSSSV